MAAAVMRGWPEAPDSPLHSAASAGAGAVGTTAELAAGELNRARRSKPCVRAGPAHAHAAIASRARTQAHRRIGARRQRWRAAGTLLTSMAFMSASSFHGLLFSPHGKANMVAGGLRSKFGKSETKPAGRFCSARPSGDA